MWTVYGNKRLNEERKKRKKKLNKNEFYGKILQYPYNRRIHTHVHTSQRMSIISLSPFIIQKLSLSILRFHFLALFESISHSICLALIYDKNLKKKKFSSITVAHSIDEVQLTLDNWMIFSPCCVSLLSSLFINIRSWPTLTWNSYSRRSYFVDWKMLN